MNKRSGFYPRPAADGAGSQVVSQAGGVLLTETIRAVGLDRELSAALARWRLPLAVHDPAKVVTDLAVMLALGGDCLADIVLLRAEPGVYGLVASDPTVSRTIDALAAEADRARARDWQLAASTSRTPVSKPRRRWSSMWTPRWRPRIARGAGRTDVQARGRVPPAVRVRRPRTRRHRGAVRRRGLGHAVPGVGQPEHPEAAAPAGARRGGLNRQAAVE